MYDKLLRFDSDFIYMSASLIIIFKINICIYILDYFHSWPLKIVKLCEKFNFFCIRPFGGAAASFAEAWLRAWV